MKFNKFVLIFLNIFLLVDFVSANTFSEIKTESYDLASFEKLSDNIDSILNYVDNTIEYEFFYKPRNIYQIWHDKKGDCSDKAILKNMMLSNIGVKSLIVHGMCDGLKHDYIIYYNDGKWFSDDKGCKKITMEGYSFW